MDKLLWNRSRDGLDRYLVLDRFTKFLNSLGEINLEVFVLDSIDRMENFADLWSEREERNQGDHRPYDRIKKRRDASEIRSGIKQLTLPNGYGAQPRAPDW